MTVKSLLHPSATPQTIGALLSAMAMAYPDRIALSDGQVRLNYRSLAEHVAQVAGDLQNRAIGTGMRVALLARRDAWAFVGFYGILRAGAAAVVLSPDWPVAELHRRLIATRVNLLLTSGVEAPPSAPCDTSDLRELARVNTIEPARSSADAVAADPAYLSFTSGSTGQPKAVVVSHGNAFHYALGLAVRLGLDVATPLCFAHLTTLSADLGHTAWLASLIAGGQLHVIDDNLARDPVRFWQAIAAAQVDVVKTTPSHLASLLNGRPPDAPRLSALLFGGERLSRALAERCLREGITSRVVNHYGPTETTVGASCFIADSVADMPMDEDSVPIGTPIGDARLVLQNSSGGIVDGPGEGELAVGGAGVTLGYFELPVETQKRFRHILIGHQRLNVYRTGDYCRRRQDGSLVFVGRVDREVKIRGYRVDPHEVERLMDKWPGVARSVAVVQRTGDDSRLAAAVVLRQDAVRDATLTGLARHLAEELPPYMVPQPIVALRSMPFGPNGKLDHSRLEDLVSSAISAEAARASSPFPVADSTTTLVSGLCGLWAEALGLPTVGRDVDVFALGGDSVLAMRTVAFLHNVGRTVRVEDIYRNPTAASLAATAHEIGSWSDLPSRSPGDGPRHLGPAQRWLFGLAIEQVRHWNQAVVLECHTRVDPDALGRSVRYVLTRHPMLRQVISSTGPVGPPTPPAEQDVLSSSVLPGPSERVVDTVAAVGEALQRSIDPATARVFLCHHFSGDAEEHDRLLLVAHHLVMDGLSWRVVLEDLGRAYQAAVHHTELPQFPTGDYWDWTAAARGGTELTPPPDVEKPAPRCLPVEFAQAAPIGPGSFVWSLDRTATDELIGHFGQGTLLEAALLDAFAAGLGAWSRLDHVHVEVETHGRDLVQGGEAFASTVGWFTAVKRVVLPTRPHRSDDDAPRSLAALLRRTVSLPYDAAGVRPEVAFNFLGTFRLPAIPELDWRPAVEAPGQTRDPAADPVYRLRLTARLVEGCLIADLVYDRQRLNVSNARRVLDGFVSRLAYLSGRRPVGWGYSSARDSSTSGLPMLIVAKRELATVQSSTRSVLLTGATGFLGAHLLMELLGRRDIRVCCLVRAANDTAALNRLEDVLERQYGFSLPTDGRIAAVAGDVCAADLGLTANGQVAAAEAEIIIHGAADVRLIAPPRELHRTNVGGTRHLLTWIDAETRKNPQLHFISTLAVAGQVNGARTRFSEDHLDIGQQFLTPYERSKFEAENVVRSQPGRASIYRVGHVAAHSRTGTFQQNVGDNRVYQILRSYALAQAAPQSPAIRFAFSYVDVVARGIVTLALDTQGRPGTRHVESPYQVRHDQVVRWLADFGYPVRLVSAEDYGVKLAELRRSDSRQADLGQYWAGLEPRGIYFDSRQTISVLKSHGVEFPRPTRGWFHKALAWAARAGYFPPPLRFTGEAAYPVEGLTSPSAGTTAWRAVELH